MIKTSDRLGNKYTCAACKSRYYDLKKLPPICPTCGLEYVAISFAPKPRRSRQPQINAA